MQKKSVVAAAIIAAIYSDSFADLLPRDIDNDNVTDTYYSTLSNTTWLAHFTVGVDKLRFGAAQTLVQHLTIGNYDHWRLPTSQEFNALAYAELGNFPNSSGYINNSSGPFTGLSELHYWTSSGAVKEANNAYYANVYDCDNGNYGPCYTLAYATAVIDGDVGVPTVPEPSMLALLILAGIAAAINSARKTTNAS